MQFPQIAGDGNSTCTAVSRGQIGTIEADLDPGIAQYVYILSSNGIETFESCEGGGGHAFMEPSVRFFGGQAAGYRALAVALENGLPVADLQRVWPIIDGEATGPWWQMTFTTKGRPV